MNGFLEDLFHCATRNYDMWGRNYDLGSCQQLVGRCKEKAGVIPHQQNPCFHDHNNSAFIILALCIQQTQLGPWCRSKP